MPQPCSLLGLHGEKGNRNKSIATLASPSFPPPSHFSHITVLRADLTFQCNYRTRLCTFMLCSALCPHPHPCFCFLLLSWIGYYAWSLAYATLSRVHEITQYNHGTLFSSFPLSSPLVIDDCGIGSSVIPVSHRYLFSWSWCIRMVFLITISFKATATQLKLILFELGTGLQVALACCKTCHWQNSAYDNSIEPFISSTLFVQYLLEHEKPRMRQQK